VSIAIEIPQSEGINPSRLIEQAFKELIDTKHLYQSIKIDFEPAIEGSAEEVLARRTAGEGFDASRTNSKSEQRRELLANIKHELCEEIERAQWLLGGFAPGSKTIGFSLLPVRTICDVCDDIEPFSLWGQPRDYSITKGIGDRIFCLPLQCQRCRQNVIVFLIRRNAAKIQIVGRSEIERPKPPDYIPKSIREYYSRATLAFQSK